jgi:hypothetical protein
MEVYRFLVEAGAVVDAIHTWSAVLCTGPSLERILVWNDTSELEKEPMLDEMQAEWLVKVVEGCGHACVGLTLWGAFDGRLSTRLLVGILGYVFGGLPPATVRVKWERWCY